MKSSLSALLLIAACLLPCTASAKDDLLTLYSLALSKDPYVGRSRARLDLSRADTRIALSQMLPRVDANAGINWISHTTLNSGPTDISGSFTGNSYGFGVRLPVFQLQSVLGLAASRASVRAADAALAGSRQEMMVQLAQAYFALLRGRSDEIFYRGQLQRFASILRQAEAMDRAGTGDVMQLHEARARMDSAAAEMLRAENQRRVAEQQLGSLAGREVTEVRDLGAYRPLGPEPAELQWWLDTLMKRHPALVNARETLVQAELQRKAAKAGHLPVLQASAGYAVSKGSTFLPQVETRQWYAGFNISLPLYSGGETAARTERAVAAESEQGFVLTAVREQALQKLKKAYMNLEYVTALISSLNQKKVSAETQLDAIRSGYDKGTRTTAELMQAENYYALARRDLVNAHYDHAYYSMELKSMAGVLEEADLVAMNGRLVE